MFSLTESNVRAGFKRAVRAACLPPDKARVVCLHTLRHTFASLLVQAGVSLLDVKDTKNG